jgi:hypothetical protein
MLYDPKWTTSEVEITLEPWRGVLLAAADLIEQKGWTQRAYKDENGYCIVGALLEINGRGWNQAIFEISGHLHQQTSSWNDAPGRTKEEVVRTMREVARKVG